MPDFHNPARSNLMEPHDKIPESEKPGGAETPAPSAGVLIKSIATLAGFVLLIFIVVTKVKNEFSFSVTEWVALAAVFVGTVLCAIKLDEKFLGRRIRNAKISENLSIGICMMIAGLILYLTWNLF
jgi:hypothetical protein